MKKSNYELFEELGKEMHSLKIFTATTFLGLAFEKSVLDEDSSVDHLRFSALVATNGN